MVHRITTWVDLMATEVEEAKVEVMGDQIITVRLRNLTSPIKRRRLCRTVNSSSIRDKSMKRPRNIS